MANEASEKDAAKAKAKAKAAAGKDASKKKKGNAVIDMFFEKGTPIQTFDMRTEKWREEGDAPGIFIETTEMKFAPYVITGFDVKFAQGDTEVAKSFIDFSTDFPNSTWRQTAERAMRTSLDSNRKDLAANDFILTTLREVCPAGAVLAPHLEASSPLRSEIGLSNFGMKCGSYHGSIERGCLWTVRLTVSGRRQVVILHVDEVKQIMKEQGVVAKECKTFAKEMGLGTAQLFINQKMDVYSAFKNKNTQATQQPNERMSKRTSMQAR